MHSSVNKNKNTLEINYKQIKVLSAFSSKVCFQVITFSQKQIESI